MTNNLLQFNYITFPMENISIEEWINISIINPLQLWGLSKPEDKEWLNWRREERDGKQTKVPYMPSEFRADSTNLATWDTFEVVNGARSRFDGIGLVFPPTMMRLGIDIDHCLKNGIITHEEKEKILKLIKEANTYAEISPSDEGLHLFLNLTVPLKLIANRHGIFEAYTKARYFTVTQNFYGDPKNVRTVTPEEALYLLSIIGYPWGKGEKSEQNIKPLAIASMDDKAVLSKMFASKHGDKIKALYDGDLTEYKNDHSSADLALCSYLAYWTGKNAEQMDRIWINSPLGAREKTQTRQGGYRDITIKKAVDGCVKVYEIESDRFELVIGPDKKIPTLKIAKHLIKKYNVKTIGERVLEPYIYKDGIYVFGLNVLKSEVQEILGQLATPQQKKNIIEMIKDSTLADRNVFNVDKNLINLENGIFDIKNNVLMPHNPEYPFFTKIPVVYDADATCPDINKFLHEILPDEYVKVVLEWFGYCLYRSYFIKKAIIFAGEKDTGKTTLLKLFARFLGLENTSGISLQKIASDKFSSFFLYGKHINIYDELAFKDINDNGQFKMVTGDGIISGEKKFGEQFQFKNYSKLTFACNKIPDVKDGNDSAYFSRWIIVPFLAEIKLVDKFLTDKITTERESSGCTDPHM